MYYVCPTSYFWSQETSQDVFQVAFYFRIVPAYPPQTSRRPVMASSGTTICPHVPEPTLSTNPIVSGEPTTEPERGHGMRRAGKRSVHPVVSQKKG